MEGPDVVVMYGIYSTVTHSLVLYCLPLDKTALHYSILHYHTILHHSKERVYRALKSPHFWTFKGGTVYYAMEQSTWSPYVWNFMEAHRVSSCALPFCTYASYLTTLHYTFLYFTTKPYHTILHHTKLHFTKLE